MLNIIPQVKSYQQKKIQLTFHARQTHWEIDSFFQDACENDFIQILKNRWGNVPKIDSKQILSIQYVQCFSTEGYSLKIEEDGLFIRASSYQGVVWALQSFMQLLPIQMGDVEQIQGVDIQDGPAYSYRGLHLDVCRHFFTVDEVKDFIDKMSFHKLNIFHWHLTDDQGWRIEIKKYPRLTQMGAIRKASPKPWDRLILDDTPYGPFFFTQAEIKEVVKYAKSRGVTVIPEIELPGHAQAALAAYPHLGCSGGPYEPWCHWGVSENVFCAGNEQTLSFLKDVLDEVIECFEGPYIHLGGDECPKIQWEKCPKCQEKIRLEQLENEEALQSWFVTQMGQYLKMHGKKMIGWDEILEGGIPDDAVVMSWQGIEGGKRAAHANHGVIMTPNDYLYFDYAQSENPDEPESIFGLVPLEKVYSFEVDCGLPCEISSFILGAQGNCWSEYFHDYKRLQYSVYPRAAALAEITWYAPQKRDFKSFKTRLEVLVQHYQSRGIHFRALDRQII